MANETAARVDEIGPGIYRLNTGVPPSAVPGGFSFNQYLVVDDEPLLFHTGLRAIFPGVRDAIARVMPVGRLRWIAHSHVEADECGALNQLLAVAPHATPVCSMTGALVSMADLADRAPKGMADGEVLVTGRRRQRWLAAPHVPHAWECGFLFDESSRTLLCGDLFTQPGSDTVPLTEGDILGPSEAFRRAFDYYSHTGLVGPVLERIAALGPRTLACMHGSAWTGDGAALLRELAQALLASKAEVSATAPRTDAADRAP